MMARVGYVLVLALALCFSAAEAKVVKDVTKLQIGVKFKPEKCLLQAHNGDTVKVHYRGSLTDGTEFDASYPRGDPFDFKLGAGQVIKGGATLIFETELIGVNGKTLEDFKEL
eukprot:jgi/Mesen1/1016/ME000121S00094